MLRTLKLETTNVKPTPFDDLDESLDETIARLRRAVRHWQGVLAHSEVDLIDDPMAFRARLNHWLDAATEAAGYGYGTVAMLELITDVTALARMVVFLESEWNGENPRYRGGAR